MKTLSFVYPYYDNPKMLAHQFGVWAAYPQELKARIEIVLVDDASPRWPALEVKRPDGLPGLRIYRVRVDKPWHQHGARNLGAREAAGDWLFMTDMDHVLPAESLAKLLEVQNTSRFYTFARLDSWTMQPTLRENGETRLHPNSFAVTKDLFWRVGGYDEDYCGVYGTDKLFLERLRTFADERHLEDVPLLRFTRDIVADASTTTLGRKEGREKGAKEKIKARKFAEGRAGEIKVLAFEWDRVL